MRRKTLQHLNKSFKENKTLKLKKSKIQIKTSNWMNLLFPRAQWAETAKYFKAQTRYNSVQSHWTSPTSAVLR